MSSITPHFVLEAGPLTGHEALFQPDWLARELPQSAGLHPSVPRVQVGVAMPGFYSCAGDVNSGLACLVCALAHWGISSAPGVTFSSRDSLRVCLSCGTLTCL